MKNGKVLVKTVTNALLEGTFYWPVSTRCTENDKHTAMDLFIIWRYVSTQIGANDEANELDLLITANLDNITEKWTKIQINSLLNNETRFYTVQMLRVILTKIWTTGLDVEVIRRYYTVIFKAARDIEEITGMGFKKLHYSQIVIIPTTVNIDGILRKRPVNYYGITVQVVTRKDATIEMLQDFNAIKDQIKLKE